MQNALVQLLRQGLEERVFPGAAAAVSWGAGRNRISAAAGIMDQRDQTPVTAATCFDLASLSKPLATALIIYGLIAEQKIHLDAPLASLLDRAIPPDKENITVRQLLSHSSGFAAYQPWFKEFAPQPAAANKELLLQRILAEPLAYPPAGQCLYSDLGFIVLGHLIEQLTGKELAEHFQERIATPLCLEQELFYISPEDAAVRRQHCAATEKCAWRGRMMRGEVHDEHCWLMNGAAGHAGLFGTATGVLRLCEAILAQWQSGNAVHSWSAVLGQGLTRQCSGQTWCLGFDTPSAGTSSSGRHFSPASIGHLGFTGTSFWIDPDKELIVVLLTNRVHSSRENTKIRAFRPHFHDRIVEQTQKGP